MSKKNSRYGKHSLGYPINNKLTDRYKNEKEKTIKKRNELRKMLVHRIHPIKELSHFSSIISKTEYKVNWIYESEVNNELSKDKIVRLIYNR